MELRILLDDLVETTPIPNSDAEPPSEAIPESMHMTNKKGGVRVYAWQIKKKEWLLRIKVCRCVKFR